MARKSRKRDTMTEISTGTVYRTAIYARLSRESQQSEKIETQIEEVLKFIENKPFFKLVETFADNGFSGTNFHRPEFERMMEEVRNGNINCIIVKDLSRFAREHVGAEDYLNNIFPFLGVRFIAVNDDYDNIHIEPQEYFMASFKNLAHAYFAQETSRKVIMTKHRLQEQGKFIGSRPAYGYMRSPVDKHELIPHPEQAAIVREIFSKAADGETSGEICAALNQKQTDGYVWTLPRICAILRKEIYKGTLVQRTSTQAFYKNEPKHQLPKKEQIRIENAVPPIVTPELWQAAQDAFADRRSQNSNIELPYYGFVFCARCGKKLSARYDRRLSDYIMNCSRCKNGVYARGSYVLQAIQRTFDLPQNEPVRKEHMQSVDKILLTDKTHIVVCLKGADVV